MRKVNRFVFLPILAGIAVVAWAASSDGRGAVQGVAQPSESSRTTPKPPAYSYVGTKRCRMCHSAQHKSWLASPKGRSWDALKPGNAPAAKRAAGLDVSTDHTANATCLPCHAVGFEHEGGYAIPDRADARTARQATNRQGAGCESCHGPGSGYVEIMSDIYATDRKYDPPELRRVGRHTVGAAVCNECHNKSAVCVLPAGTAPGDREHRSRYEVRVEDRNGYHARFPLLHRRAEQPAAPSGDEQKDEN